MADRVITMRINVETGKSVENVDDLEDSLKGVNETVEEIGESSQKLDPLEKKLTDLNIKVKAGDQDFRQLRKTIQDYQALAIAAGETSPIGQAAIENVALLEKELLTLPELITKVEDELRNLDKASRQDQAVKSFKELNAIVEDHVLSIQELGAAADNYKNIAIAAGVQSPIGKEALIKAAEMENEMDKLNQSVAQLAEGGRNLNAAMQLGQGVIAGYAAFQGVTALAGVESEKLQETFVKLQAAQAALAGITELKIALDKKGILMTTLQSTATNVLTFAQATYNTVIGASTGLMKVFKIALAATGIGLLVVGLGLLIANFDSIKAAVNEFIEKLFDMKTGALLLLGPIGLLIIAYKLLFGEISEGERDAAKAAREQRIAFAKQHAERIKQLKAERKAQKEAHGERQTQFDLDIERADALGQASEDLKLKKLQDLNEELKAQIQFIVDSGKAWEDYYENLRAQRGQSREDFIASMKAQGVDLEKLQGQQQELIDEIEQKVFSSESKIISFKRQMREKNQAEAEKANSEIEKEEQRHLDEMIKLLDTQVKANEVAANKLFNNRKKVIDRIAQFDKEERLDQFQIRMDDLSDQFAKEMELFINNESTRADLQREFEANINTIKEEARQADAELEAAEMEERLGSINAIIETAGMAVEKLSQINDIMNEIGERRKEKVQSDRDDDLASLEESTKKELANERLSAQQKAVIEQKSAIAEFKIRRKAAEAEDKIARRQFQRNKAIKLAEIAVNTAAAVVQSLAAFPPPASFIVAGITGGIGAAQAALVASQSFKGSAGSIQPPSFSAPDISSGGGDTSTSSSGATQTNGQGTNVDDLINRQQQVVVSQVEINSQQANLANVEEVSTIG